MKIIVILVSKSNKILFLHLQIKILLSNKKIDFSKQNQPLFFYFKIFLKFQILWYKQLHQLKKIFQKLKNLFENWLIDGDEYKTKKANILENL